MHEDLDHIDPVEAKNHVLLVFRLMLWPTPAMLAHVATWLGNLPAMAISTVAAFVWAFFFVGGTAGTVDEPFPDMAVYCAHVASAGAIGGGVVGALVLSYSAIMFPVSVTIQKRAGSRVIILLQVALVLPVSVWSIVGPLAHPGMEILAGKPAIFESFAARIVGSCFWLPVFIGYAIYLGAAACRRLRVLGLDLRCRHCGYVLIGLIENRCPECGLPFTPAVASPAKAAWTAEVADRLDRLDSRPAPTDPPD